MWKLSVVSTCKLLTLKFDDYDELTDCLHTMLWHSVDKLKFEVTYEPLEDGELSVI